MNKKYTLFCMLVFIIYPYYFINSQPWEYGFGNTTGIYNTTNSWSTTFLPPPPSGIARIKIGLDGYANLTNESIGFGSGIYLRMVATTDDDTVNKFSIYGFNNPSSTFKLRFDLRFSGGGAGNFTFFCGSDVSTNGTYNGSGGGKGIDVFTGIHWTYGTNPSIETSVRQGGNWGLLNGADQFSQNTNYIVEIYCNNSSDNVNYEYSLPNDNSVASNRWDIWINGVLIGDDIQKDGLSDLHIIDAFTFLGSNSSTGPNSATIYIDNIYYTNEIPSEPLPVEHVSLLPDKFKLSQNYPNPFNPVTNIGFRIPYSTKVRIDVYDILGQHVETLVSREFETGFYNVVFDASGLPGGTYIYRIIADNFSQSEKMILLK